MSHVANNVINWSPQQIAFLDWCENGSGSTVLEAVAGAGKTTTLVEAAKRIRGQVAMMVYNRKNADEMKLKITKAGMDWKKCQGGTAHSFGFSGYRKFREAAEAGNVEAADAAMRAASIKLDKAASKGVIHKNQAANRKSAIAKRAEQLKSA